MTTEEVSPLSGQAVLEIERVPKTITIEDINSWFYDNFYNKSLPVDVWNHCLKAKDDLLTRLK